MAGIAVDSGAVAVGDIAEEALLGYLKFVEIGSCILIVASLHVGFGCASVAGFRGWPAKRAGGGSNGCEAACGPTMAQLWPNYGPTMAQPMAQLWPN